MGDEHRQRLGHRAGQVLVGVDRDQALDVQRRLDVDVEDAGVRVRRPHEGGGQGGVPDVVEVAALADDQPGVLAPADRLPEELRRHSGPPPAARAAGAAAPDVEPRCGAAPAPVARLRPSPVADVGMVATGYEPVAPRGTATVATMAVTGCPSSRRRHGGRPS
jgi:hypothetical protein